MPLKSVVDTLDGVDEAARAFYTEKDGKHVLDISDIREHPGVTPLANAYNRIKDDLSLVKDEKQSLTEKLDAFPSDFSMEAWNAAKSGQADAAAIAAAKEEAKVEVRTAMQGEIDEWKGKFEGEISTNRNMRASAALRDELAKAGVKEPAFMDGALAMLQPKVSFDKEGNPVMEDPQLGPMTIAETVEKWATADGKPFVSQPTGGGASGKDKPANPGSKSAHPELATAVPGFADLPEK